MNEKIYSKDFIEMLRNQLDTSSYKYVSYPKLVFLCGKAKDSNYNNSSRGKLERYLLTHSSEIHIVLSESIWEDNSEGDIDLLTFEEFLAETSDYIVLFVESPGSCCELGAFAYNEIIFSKKLTIVIDKSFENDKSFIQIGPTTKAKKDGATVVYAPIFQSSLLSSEGLRDVANGIIQECTPAFVSAKNKRIPNKGSTILVNTFILELLDLLHLLQPISPNDLLEIYKLLKGINSFFTFVKSDGKSFHQEITYSTIINLLIKLKVITSENSLLKIIHDDKIQSIMLNMTKTVHNKERNRLLCRKYKYGECK